MAAFLVCALVMLARRDPLFRRNGFSLMVLWYAAQRFVWEFLKPSGAIAGSLNLFQLICLGLIVYGQSGPWHADAAARSSPELRR